MENKINIVKRNWIPIVVILLLVFLIFQSFFIFFKENYSYGSQYYEDMEKCKKDPTAEICKIVLNMEKLDEKFAKEDTISMYFQIVNNYFSNSMIIICPLLIILLVIHKVHDNFSSGNVKNYLMRESWKKYKKRLYKASLKAALIIPISLIVIFLISGIITKFNFNVSETIKQATIYDEWNYTNFPLYLLIHSLILYLMGVFYGNLTLLCLTKSKNKLITIILSYVSFFIAVIFIYVFVYAIILNKVFGLSGLMNYFNIFDFWKIYTSTANYGGILLMAFSLLIVSLILVMFHYQKKEKVLISNEKEVV